MCFLHFPTTYPWYAGPPFSGPGVLEVEETLEFLKLESRSRINCYFITTCSALTLGAFRLWHILIFLF